MGALGGAPPISLTLAVQELIEDSCEVVIVLLKELGVQLTVSKTHSNESVHWGRGGLGTVPA